MDEPESSRSRWFDLRVAVMLGFLAFVACFVGWKWAESDNRSQFLEELARKGVMYSRILTEDKWSGDWPFYNVVRVEEIYLVEGTFDDRDVRSLRTALPGVVLYRVQPPSGTIIPMWPATLVRLPEDQATASHGP